jgi:hypothetical protein
MPRIEIRWRERAEDPVDEVWDGYIELHESVDPYFAMEETFKNWLEKKISKKCGVIVDFEFHVDGEYYPLTMAQKNKYRQRIIDSALETYPVCEVDDLSQYED